MSFVRRGLSGVVMVSVTAGLLVAAVGFLRPNEETFEWGVRGTDGAEATSERVIPVLTARAEVGAVTPQLQAFGRVEAVRLHELRAGVGGELIALSDNLRAGGRVEAGEILVQLDPADAEAALARAEADLREARVSATEAGSSLELVRAELATAITQRDVQARALERQRGLDERGVGSTASVDAAELSLSQSEQAVLSRRQAVLAAETGIERAAIAVERATLTRDDAARRLAATVLRAPFAAAVTEARAGLGEQVNAGTTLATLIDPDALEVAFQVTSAQAARLTAGDGSMLPLAVNVRLDGSNAPPRAGTLSRSGASVAEGETGRVLYAALAPGAVALLKPGDFVSVTLDEPALKRVARLPASAVSANGRIFTLAEDSRLIEREVRVVRRQASDVLVAGLRDGLQYVQDRQPRLGEGIKVRVLGEEAAAEPEPDMVELTEARRTELLTRLDAAQMPDRQRHRMREALAQPRVPAAMIQRIETWTGG